MPKTSWYRCQRNDAADARRARDVALADEIRDIIEAHPGYGWRRIQTELDVRGQRVNHKRLKRVLDENGLALRRHIAKRRRSAPSEVLELYAGDLNLVHGETFGPLEALSTDFTEFKIADGQRKAWLIAFVDLHTRVVVGWAVGERRCTELALRAWSAVSESYRDLGVSLAGTVVHSDKDGVFTGYRWLERLLLDDGTLVSFSEHGARHNPWIESCWARMKTEWASRLTECATVVDAEEVVDAWFSYYNHRRFHSSLDNQSPASYLETLGVVNR